MKTRWTTKLTSPRAGLVCALAVLLLGAWNSLTWVGKTQSAGRTPEGTPPEAGAATHGVPTPAHTNTSSTFQSANWDLSGERDGGSVALPVSLSGTWDVAPEWRDKHVGTAVAFPLPGARRTGQGAAAMMERLRSMQSKTEK